MPAQSSIAGKKCLVTGAGRGIGRALVAELVSHGAVVYALSKNSNNLKSLKAEFPGIIPICVDLADWNATRNILDPLEAIDCLINNAALCASASFLNITPESFDDLFNVNLKSVINVSQVIAKKMIKSGKGGSIVNISSVAASKAFLDNCCYCCTKASLEMLTKIMAAELGKYKIRVNSIKPAAVDTDMLHEIIEASGVDVPERLKVSTPTQKGLMPMRDVVNAIMFFVSDLTSQITGESLAIDGGLLVG